MKLNKSATQTFNLLHHLYGEKKRSTYTTHTLILVDSSKPERLVSGCEASDENYFGVDNM
jgi:hypothetical protein